MIKQRNKIFTVLVLLILGFLLILNMPRLYIEFFKKPIATYSLKYNGVHYKTSVKVPEDLLLNNSYTMVISVPGKFLSFHKKNFELKTYNNNELINNYQFNFLSIGHLINDLMLNFVGHTTYVKTITTNFIPKAEGNLIFEIYNPFKNGSYDDFIVINFYNN